MENKSDYVVLSWKPYKKVTKVDMNTLDEYESAEKLANNKRMQGCDAIIVEKYVTINRFTNKEEICYEVKNFGYYKTYKVLNYLIGLLSLILFVGFIYLYYKILK